MSKKKQTTEEPEKMLPATQEAGEMVSQADAALPDYLRGFGSEGNENVGREDFTVPRLVVLQALSPEVDPSNAQKYMPDAKIGMIMNTVTRSLTNNLQVVNVYFVKEFAVFKKRSAGGGFRGVFPSQGDAISFVENQEDARDLEVTEQAVHYLLLLNPETKQPCGEAALVMTSTKMKVSRNWNALIKLASGPRFAGVWDLSTVSEKNAKGAYFNLTVKPAGFIPAGAVPAARALLEAVSTGAKSVDREQDASIVEEGNY